MAYVKQTWENLPSKTTPLTAARLSHMETQYDEALSESKSYTDGVVSSVSGGGVSVSSFGAVGDGVTDDSSSIQAAIDSLPQNGGDVLLSVGAVHLIKKPLVLRTGVTLRGSGSTLLKNSSSGEHLTLTVRSKPNAKGYGGGGTGITVRDVSIRGTYGGTGTFWEPTCNFHHVENLTIKNVTFSQGMVDGHYLDLLGCKNVLIDGCRFLGSNPRSSREYIEAVQVDSSTLSGSSDKAEEPTSFDGLPTINVTVTGCYFGGYRVGGTLYPTPCAIGQHSAALVGSEGWYEGITITGNTFDGSAGASTAWYGMVRLPGARNVTITGNTFRGSGTSPGVQSSVAISAPLVSQVIPLTGVSQLSPARVPATPPRGTQSFVISGNSFLGFKNTEKSVIHIEMPERTLDADVTVSGNTVTTSGRSVFLKGLGAARVSGNNLTGAAGDNVRVESSNRVMFDGNTVVGAARGVVFNGVDNGSVSNNLVSDYTSQGVSIGSQFTAGDNPSLCWDISVHGNRVRSPGSAPSASVAIEGGSRRAYFWGNRLRDGGAVIDNGTGTITSPANQTT